jgi:tRNA threonylcarbamoyladenosine biosynthesis protein TsaB
MLSEAKHPFRRTPGESGIPRSARNDKRAIHFQDPMLLLAADTSGKDGSIALAKCGPGDVCEIIEVVPLAGGTFSAQLVPQIAELLLKHQLGKQDIEGFAVASGPGSFTGLRVGLAAVKALAEVLRKPIAEISLLEAIASASGLRGTVMAALDAGRNELYVGEYDVQECATPLNQSLLTREEFLASVRGYIVTPDASLADVARNAGLPVKEIPRPRSDTIAQLGWKKILAGDTVSPEVLDANYIRRSDAEIFSKGSS